MEQNQQKHEWSAHVGCIDDRDVQPVRVWTVEKFGVQLVDSVTQGGMDGFLSAPLPEDKEARHTREIELNRIKRDLFISL